MQAERRRLSHRRPIVHGIQPLVVERVPDFVEEREESAREVAGVITQRDPDVPRADRGAERVVPDVETSTLEIESQRGGDAFDEEALALERKLAGEHMAGS